MALRTSDIYAADAQMIFSVIDRDFDALTKKPTLTLKDLSTFKATDEAAFFGAYVNNSTVKSAVYNQLRINAFTLLNKIRTNQTALQTIPIYCMSNTNVVNALQARVNEVARLKHIRGFQQVRSYFQGMYNFNIKTKILVSATFDDVTLKAEFNYKNNTPASPLYLDAINFDYVT